MGWYKTGSVNLVQGNNQVVGVGTDFVTNVNPGAIFCGPDGRICEVDAVVSATVLSLVRGYAGASVNGAAFAIAPTQSYIVDLARQVTTLLGTFGSLRDDYQAGNLVGAGLELRGVLSDPSLLPAAPVEGDAYLVGSSIYVWAKVRWDHSSIQGPKGDVGDVNPANIEAAASALDSKTKAAVSADQAQASATAASGAAAAAAADADIVSGAAATATTRATDAAASAAAAATSAQQARDAVTQAQAGQVQADWAQADPANKGFIAHKPVLAAVATSGSKVDVGLGNVDNTSDANKPVSTAQAAADAATLNSAKAYADGLVVGLWDDRGNYDASANAWPAANGSGAAGAILKGDIWTVTVAGTLGGVPVAARQTVRALVDAPGQIAANWSIGLANTDIEDSITSGVTGRAPSQAAVFTALAGKEAVTAAGTTGQYRRGDKTWQDLATDVRAVVLTGLSTATNAVIGAGDSILAGMGKLQAQITAAIASIATKAAKGANSDITSLLGLSSVEINAAIPYIYLNETDQSGAAGKWRILAEGGALRVDMNTAAARDFSTAANNLFLIDATGKCTTNGSVVQGGGTGQGSNRVYLGWGSSGGGLKCTVDATDQGYIPFSGANPAAGTATFGFGATFGQAISASGNTTFSNGTGTALTVNGTAVVNYGLQVSGAPTSYFLCGSLLSAIGGSGMLQVGATGGLNIVHDYQAIQARNNGAASTLVLNYYGGVVSVGPSGLTSGGNLYTQRDLFADGWCYFRATSDVKIALYRGGSTPEGYIGTSTAGNYCFIAINKDNTAYRFAVDNSGNALAWGNVTAYSDGTLKRNWKPVCDDFLEQLVKVQYGVYDRIDIDLTQVGMVAQDVRKFCPEAVSEQANGKLTLNYGALAGVASIKLAERVLSLEAKFEEAKNVINLLLEKVSAQ